MTSVSLHVLSAGSTFSALAGLKPKGLGLKALSLCSLATFIVSRVRATFQVFHGTIKLMSIACRKLRTV